jgi:hypothetical protein
VSSLPAIAAMVAVRVFLPTGTGRLLLGAAVGVGLGLVAAVAQLGPAEVRARWRALVSSPPPPVAPDRL